jgi:purine-binding chemotaxis protein CheW
MDGNQQFVTIGVDAEIFAAPVAKVEEILELRPISRLPQAPANLLGLIDVRGAGIAVLDLRATLGLPPTQDTPATRIVVLRVNANGRALKVGLKADRVYEVTVLDSPELEPAESLGMRWSGHAIAGIGRRGGAFVTVFDLDRLLGGAELAELAPAVRGPSRAA